MHIEEDGPKHNEDEALIGSVIGDDIIDEFSDDALVDEEEALPPLHEDEEEIYDFLSEEDDRDSMY